jgi:hypothetical protein
MVRNLSKFLKASCASAVVLAALGASPSSALAGRFDTHRGDDDHRDRWRHDDRGRDYDRGGYGRGSDGGHLDFCIGGGTRGAVYCPPPPPPPPVCEETVWVAPVYRTVCEQRWVEPVYRTVCDRVWIEPVTRTDYERGWIPDRYEWHDVDHYANGKRYTSREYVLVEPAHWGDVPHVTVLTPGHYEDRPRQELVSAGHFETVEHQELMVPGHYEVIRPAAVVIERPPARYEESHARIDVRFPL